MRADRRGSPQLLGGEVADERRRASDGARRFEDGHFQVVVARDAGDGIRDDDVQGVDEVDVVAGGDRCDFARGAVGQTAVAHTFPVGVLERVGRQTRELLLDRAAAEGELMVDGFFQRLVREAEVVLLRHLEQPREVVRPKQVRGRHFCGSVWWLRVGS